MLNWHEHRQTNCQVDRAGQGLGQGQDRMDRLPSPFDTLKLGFKQCTPITVVCYNVIMIQNILPK